MEYEKAKTRGASENYLSYIRILSLIDGSHKEHLKVQKGMVSMFDDLHHVVGKEISEEEIVKIIAAKSWINGFNWALTNKEKII